MSRITDRHNSLFLAATGKNAGVIPCQTLSYDDLGKGVAKPAGAVEEYLESSATRVRLMQRGNG